MQQNPYQFKRFQKFKTSDDMKTNSVTPPRKNGNQVIREKLKDVNEYLKTVDLTIVYESVGTQTNSKNLKQITKI